MMKIIIPSILLPLINPKLKILSISLTFIMMTLLLLSPNTWSTSIFNPLMSLDQISFTMIFLTLSTLILISLSSYQNSEIIPLTSLITFILLLTFFSSKSIMFFVFFESVLIPTTILVSKKGNSPERLQAGVYLLMYTLFGSFPLLLGLLWNFKFSDMNALLITNPCFPYHLLFLTAFLMKLPMFCFHLWLPKAHVEAPLEGSMILAAILLKLGGYGIIRLSPAIQFLPSFTKNLLMTIGLLGATLTSINCLRQKDLKALIAYSSVAHMGLVLAASFSFKQIGVQSAIIMMFAHGLTSSALFFIVTSIYTNNRSRNILTFKGLLLILPNLTFWWFILMILNMSAPPSLNILSEIIMFSSIIQMDVINMFPIFLASFSTASFSIILYTNLSHNSPTFFNSFSPSFMKTLSSLFTHVFPLIFFISKPEMLMPSI